MTMNKCIALTGGIGSGKSVVSRVLTTMGYAVYDCDSRAKALMRDNADVRRELAQTFGIDILTAQGVDNTALAERVFTHPEALNALNAIVHPAVTADLVNWRHHQSGTCFVETAILHESRLDTLVDEAWWVDAPVDTRVARVMRRNNMTRDLVLQRVNAQQCDPATLCCPVHIVVNDDATPVLPQLLRLLHDK